MSSPTTNQITNSSQVSGVTLTDVLNALRVTVGDGSGDMLRSVYDTDDDGKVDVANVAESVPWAGITEKPTLFPAQPYTHSHAISDVTGLQTALDSKQPTLVSSENIKTVNGNSILGVGNLTIANGVTDHGVLTGLADDDHTQYHNDARGDARYSLLGHTHTITNVTGLQTALDTATNYTAAGTGGATRLVSARLDDYISVTDYGAVADNTTDCTSAFNNAMARAIANGHKRIYIPGAASYYKLSSTITVATSGVTFYGDGPHATKIRTESASHGFDVDSGLIGVSFQNFMLTRTAGTAGVGKSGIRFNTTTEQAVLRNLYLSRHQVGLSLGGTNYSYAEELLLTDNYSHGITIDTNATNNTAQWTFFKCLSQRNDGYGLFYSTASGTAQTSVGDISLFSTYANKLGGAIFLGKSGAAIQGIRWFGGFVGEDGNHGIALSTHNTVEHKIEGVFAEIAGTSACGVDGTTAATNTGNGIWIDSNNGPVTIKDSVIVSNSYSGIYIAASRGHIVGCTLRANGVANVGGERNGIVIGAGQTSVVGCTSKGHFNYGVYSYVDGVHVVSNDLRENTSDAYGQTPAFTTSVVAGNIGYASNYLVGDVYRNGTKLLGARDTGWTAMTGTANEATSYATGTVTLVQLAERVKALQGALTTHGIIGA